MNQQFATMGQPGATPYTYAGERIAGFDPRELAGFELADQAIGSYAPYLNRQTDLSEAGLTTGLGDYNNNESMELKHLLNNKQV